MQVSFAWFARDWSTCSLREDGVMFGPICRRSARLLVTTPINGASLQPWSFSFEDVLVVLATNGDGICNLKTQRRSREFFVKISPAVTMSLHRNLAVWEKLILQSMNIVESCCFLKVHRNPKILFSKVTKLCNCWIFEVVDDHGSHKHYLSSSETLAWKNSRKRGMEKSAKWLAVFWNRCKVLYVLAEKQIGV